MINMILLLLQNERLYTPSDDELLAQEMCSWLMKKSSNFHCKCYSCTYQLHQMCLSIKHWYLLFYKEIIDFFF